MAKKSKNLFKEDEVKEALKILQRNQTEKQKRSIVVPLENMVYHEIYKMTTAIAAKFNFKFMQTDVYHIVTTVVFMKCLDKTKLDLDKPNKIYSFLYRLVTNEVSLEIRKTHYKKNLQYSHEYAKDATDFNKVLTPITLHDSMSDEFMDSDFIK